MLMSTTITSNIIDAYDKDSSNIRLHHDIPLPPHILPITTRRPPPSLMSLPLSLTISPPPPNNPLISIRFPLQQYINVVWVYSFVYGKGLQFRDEYKVYLNVSNHIQEWMFISPHTPTISHVSYHRPYINLVFCLVKPKKILDLVPLHLLRWSKWFCETISVSIYFGETIRIYGFEYFKSSNKED